MSSWRRTDAHCSGWTEEPLRWILVSSRGRPIPLTQVGVVNRLLGWKRALREQLLMDSGRLAIRGLT
jgi:hypothetical protein